MNTDLEFHAGGLSQPPPRMRVDLVAEYPSTAFDPRNDRTAYHCPHCEGWVVRSPDRRRVQDALRDGTAVVCIRCNQEIAFSGVLSPALLTRVSQTTEDEDDG